MTSLRSRLVAWYVGMASVVVLFVALLASIAFARIASYGVRESIDRAAQNVPDLVVAFEKQFPQETDLETYLQNRLSPLGVIVAVGPPAGIPGALFPIRRPPEGVDFSPPPGPPMFVRLLAIEEHPVSVSFPGGTAVLFVDPARLRASMMQIWIAVGFFSIIFIAAAWRVAIVVADNTLQPLVRTTRALNRFGDGDFTPEAVRTDDRSELGDLARAYNRAVAQITQAFDERTRAESEMRQFVADAGHQLRTPLTVVMGYLSAMAARTESPRRALVFSSMLTQSRRMKSLIDNLITLARLEHAGGYEERVIDVNGLLEQIPGCFEEAVQSRLAVKPCAQPLFIRANEGDLLDALCALADNALKYAPEGPVEIAASSSASDCVITIEDRGPGMSDEDLDRAFDRFYRGAAGDAVAGTGLGLSIIRKSVERAAGTVSLANRDGGGLVCTVRIPLEPALRAAL